MTIPPAPEPWFTSDPQSPFIPGTYLQFAWDATSLSAFKKCPRFYEYTTVRGLRGKGTSAHLIFGQHYHSGLELYDRLRCESVEHDPAVREVVLRALQWTWEPAIFDESHDIIIKEAGPWQSPHNTKTRENLIRSLVWYLEEFGANDPLRTLTLSDGRPAVELSFRFDSTIEIWKDYSAGQGVMRAETAHEAGIQPRDIPMSYILCGHLDRIAYFGEDLYIADRKTSGSALTPYFFEGFNPHTQMTLYTLAGQLVYNLPIKGIIIDGAQIAVGFTRFGRGFSPRTKGELEEYFTDLHHWFALAERYAAQRYWPKNEESCDKYGGCPFRKVCSRDPAVREAFIKSDFEVSPWNPLKER